VPPSTPLSRTDGFVVGRIRVDADDDAGPAAVAVGECSGIGRYPRRGPIDRVEVHGRVSGGQPLAEGAVDLDGLVGDLVEEVGSPVSVQAGGIERVERGGQHVVGHWLNADNQWRTKAADLLEPGIGLAMRSGAPDDAAGLPTPYRLRERRRWRDCEQGDPAAEIFGLGRLELAVPAHYLGGGVDVVEDGAGVDDAVLPDGGCSRDELSCEM